eukprot:1160927-Pelagomonas_calceolata.AAC.2
MLRSGCASAAPSSLHKLSCERVCCAVGAQALLGSLLLPHKPHSFLSKGPLPDLTHTKSLTTESCLTHPVRILTAESRCMEGNTQLRKSKQISLGASSQQWGVAASVSRRGQLR